MISVNELRAGATFLLDGKPFQVLKYAHSKIGRGSANVKVKVKSLLNGSVVEKTFISGAKVEPITILKKRMQYLYQDEDQFWFMNPVTFDQISIEERILGNGAKFLKDNQEVLILFWENKPLLIELPASLVLRVAKTVPGVKGDSATNIWKDAELENGLRIKVPLFIGEGDRVKVDTRTEEYVERIK